MQRIFLRDKNSRDRLFVRIIEKQIRANLVNRVHASRNSVMHPVCKFDALQDCQTRGQLPIGRGPVKNHWRSVGIFRRFSDFRRQEIQRSMNRRTPGTAVLHCADGREEQNKRESRSIEIRTRSGYVSSLAPHPRPRSFVKAVSTHC